MPKQTSASIALFPVFIYLDAWKKYEQADKDNNLEWRNFFWESNAYCVSKYETNHNHNWYHLKCSSTIPTLEMGETEKERRPKKKKRTNENTQWIKAHFIYIFSWACIHHVKLSTLCKYMSYIVNLVVNTHSRYRQIFDFETH